MTEILDPVRDMLEGQIVRLASALESNFAILSRSQLLTLSRTLKASVWQISSIRIYWL